MEKEDTSHTIGIYLSKDGTLPLCQHNDANDKHCIQQQQKRCSQKAFLLSDGTENEISMLLWNILQMSLRSLHVSFSQKTAGADGNLCLIHIIPRSLQIFFESQQYFYTFTLMLLKQIVESIIDRILECNESEGEQCQQRIGKSTP